MNLRLEAIKAIHEHRLQSREKYHALVDAGELTREARKLSDEMHIGADEALDTIGFLLGYIEEQDAHIEGIEDERNLYLTWFDVRDISPADVTKEVRGYDI